MKLDFDQSNQSLLILRLIFSSDWLNSNSISISISSTDFMIGFYI